MRDAPYRRNAAGIVAVIGLKSRAVNLIVAAGPVIAIVLGPEGGLRETCFFGADRHLPARSIRLVRAGGVHRGGGELHHRDTNGDLLLSKTEYLLVALDALHKLDKNGNDAIDPDEIGDLAKDAEFEDGDSDKSGSLSVEEVISEKLADFEAADTNKDGALNVEEVTEFEAKKN